MSFGQFETLLREFISPAVVNLVLEDDDPVWSLIDTFDPLTTGGRTTGGAAGYEAQWKVKVQDGGRVSGQSFAGNTLSQVGKSSHLSVGQTISNLYLDPQDTPLPAWITIKMALKRIIGSVTVSHEQIMAELATKPIDEVAGNHVMDAVSRVRSLVTNSFWGGSNTVAQGDNKSSAIMATLTTDPGDIGNGDANRRTYGLAAGTFAKFKKGDMIEVGYNANPGTDTFLTQRAGTGSKVAYVVDIDREARTISLECKSGSTITSVTIGDCLVLAGTYVFDGGAGFETDELATRIPHGIESFLASSGTFPGTSLDIADYSDLKAFVSGDETALDDPTPEAVALILDKISDGGYAPPEALFAERSLWTLYGQLERESGAQYVVPQGAGFVGSGGVDGPVVQHMGNRFQRFSSTRMRPGSMVGLAPSTIKKYIPLGDKTVHWVYGNGPLAGTSSIFGAVHSSTQLSELADAPFNVYCEFSCDKPGRNFRRVGFKTQRNV